MSNEKGKLSKRGLRKKAEEILSTNPREVPTLPTDEVQTLVHELEVHQVELEMQQEELEGTQKALRDTCERLLELYDFAPVGYLTLSGDTRVLGANPAASAMLGVERKKLTACRFIQFIDRTAQDDWHRLFHAAGHSQDKIAQELRLRSGDGRAWIGRIECVQVPPQQGGEKRWLLAMMDVTARRKAEEARQQSQKRLEGLVNAAMDPIISIDSTGKIVLFNLAAETAFGCSARQAIGQSFERFLPPRFLPVYHKQLCDFSLSNVPSQRLDGMDNLAGLRFDGAEFPLEATITQVDVAGDKTFTLILRDISERKLAQDKLEEMARSLEKQVQRRTVQLQESQGRLALAMSAATLAVWDCDLVTDRLTVSPEWWKMLGYDPTAVAPTHTAWRTLVHPEDLPRVEKRLSSHLEGRSPDYECEYRMKTAADAWRWVESRGRIVASDPQGRPTRLIGVHLDISERKKAAALLETYQHNLRSLANELLAVEERERRRLALDLHDGPIQLIVAANMKLEALRRTPALAAAHDALQDTGELLIRAVHNLSTMTFELSPPVLHDLGLKAALNWLTEDLKRLHKLDVKLVDDGGPFVLDVKLNTMLYRCIRELLTNVAKHAKTKNAQVVLKRGDATITVEVTDNGTGFDPGYKPGKILDTPGKGGFGLFSMHERLDHLGGHLEIISTPGAGTTVTLTVPLTLRPPRRETKT